ncbi:hypothetical protein N9T98_00065 [bacterium]|nr:hypothetical protein [bacterium]
MKLIRKTSLALVLVANSFPASAMASMTTVSHSKSYCGKTQFESKWTRKNDGVKYHYLSGTFYESCKGIESKGCYKAKLKHSRYANPIKDERVNVGFFPPKSVFNGGGMHDKWSDAEHKQNKMYAQKLGGC